MTLFLLFLLMIGSIHGWTIIAALPVLSLQILFTAGLGMLLATINVFYRDVDQTIQIVLQFWFWLTPIVYIPITLPRFVQEFMRVNPFWYFVTAYHTIFLEDLFPDWSSLIYPLILTAFLLLLSMLAFYKLHGEIVDEL